MSGSSSLFRLMISSFWQNKYLIKTLTKRDVIGRYHGSVLGLAWSFFNPLLMLAIYTFVFSIIFKARWGTAGETSTADFAIILFVGLIVHGVFADCVNRAPGLILENVNYVKKVIFPLDILPWVSLGTTLFHTAVSLVVLLLVQLILNHPIPWTVILFPIVLLPLVFAAMGLSWFLASLGVYLRDVSQITGILTTVLLYMSGVFYPISALPEKYQYWLELNPLAYIITEGRNSLVFGVVPDIKQWMTMMVISLFMAWLGFAWFQKTRKGFSDVL